MVLNHHMRHKVCCETVTYVNILQIITGKSFDVATCREIDSSDKISTMETDEHDSSSLQDNRIDRAKLIKS